MRFGPSSREHLVCSQTGVARAMLNGPSGSLARSVQADPYTVCGAEDCALAAFRCSQNSGLQHAAGGDNRVRSIDIEMGSVADIDVDDWEARGFDDVAGSHITREAKDFIVERLR